MAFSFCMNNLIFTQLCYKSNVNQNKTQNGWKWYNVLRHLTSSTYFHFQMLISLVFMMVMPVLCFQCPIPPSSHTTNVICIFIAALPIFTMSYVMFVYRFTVNIQLPTRILAQIGCLHPRINIS